MPIMITCGISCRSQVGTDLDSVPARVGMLQNVTRIEEWDKRGMFLLALDQQHQGGS
jgi:hypothetical protein